MSHLVYSFAVFDTCLVRLHARPLDQLFALAALAVPGVKGQAEREDRHEFVRMRLRAEEEARARAGLEAAGLGMVYERFPMNNPWDLDPEHLYSTELEMTLQDARPAPAVLDLVRGHARRGERVVYISDSLLPGPSLRRLLEAHGFAGEVYTAGELGKRKSTGSLYRHVLAVQSVEAGEMLHTGADPVLDVRVPKSMGMAVRPYPEARFTTHEEHLLALHRACAPECSRVVAASRLARLRAAPDTGLSPVRALAASVAAPALTAFTAWAMADCSRRGGERLYFLAREGEVLYRLAQVLRPVTGGPEPRYLLGSLAAWTAPLLSVLSREDLDWLVQPGQSRRPSRLLDRLSLTPEELLRASGRSMPRLLSEKPLSDEEDLDLLWELLDSPGARLLLADKAGEARELLLDYLRQEGALEGDRLAVADMGWTLFTQRALREVLAGSGVEVEGWYFGLASRRLGRMEAGAHHAWFMERAAQALPGTLESVLFRNSALMERAFTRSGHGRVLGYERAEGRVRPKLGPDPDGGEFTLEIQETALAFARGLVGSGWGEETVRALLDVARESLRCFLLEPDNSLARAVAALPGQDEPSRPLLRRFTLSDVARAWLSSLGRRIAPRKPPLWIEGSAAISAAWLRPYLRRPRLMSLLRAYFP
jgi:FMN phosphatase YigB (HAD superfamily)